MQALEQVQLFLFLLELEEHPAPHTFAAPGRPLLQDFAHAQHLGHSGDQDVEIAGIAVHQGGHAAELRHQLVRVCAALEVDGQLEAGEVGLVAHVVDLADLAGLDQLLHLVHNGLGGGGVRDLVDLNDVFFFQIAPFGPDLERAAAGLVDLRHLQRIVEDLASCGKVRRRQGLQQVAVRVPDPGDGGLAYLPQVEPADVAGHTHGDAGVGRDQHIREGGGQQGGLEHRCVVVVHHIHGVLVDVGEQLAADGRQLGLGVAGRGVGHIAGIDLAEVALGVHERRQQGAVAPGQTHHGLIDGGVAVGVELHGLADDVGALGARAGQKPHLVHGVQKFPVGGLEAVDLRDGAGDDDAHGVGHVVLFQGVGDGLFGGLAAQSEDIRVRDDSWAGVVGRGFLLHLRLQLL